MNVSRVDQDKNENDQRAEDREKIQDFPGDFSASKNCSSH